MASSRDASASRLAEGARSRVSGRLPCDERRRHTLLDDARRGDLGARARLVECHLQLVRAIAWRYRDDGLPLEDLVQEGSIGLLDAIDRFDPGRGPTFESYARFRVRRAIRNALTDQARLIRLPKQIVERRRALDRAEARLAATGQRPTPGDLVEASGLSLAAVLEARTAALPPVSLDEPILPNGATLQSLVADPAATDPATDTIEHEQSAMLERALARLPERQRRVVSAQWGLHGRTPTSPTEIGRELELSPRRAQTIARDALHTLRGHLERTAASW